LDDGLCESFNGRVRDECLNLNEFASSEQALQTIDAWQFDCYERRPHGALRHLTPGAYGKAGQKRSLDAANF